MNIYVGNLSYEVTDSDLRAAFSSIGEVTSAKVIVDNYTNKSKGFGFVEMSDSGQAKQAIEQLNGSELKGRAITVNEARPKKEGGGGGGGGKRFGGGGGGGPRRSGGGGGRNW